MPRRRIFKHPRLYWTVLVGLLLAVVAVTVTWYNLRPTNLPPVLINSYAKVLPGIEYCNSSNPSLSLNLYYPKTAITTKLPLVVYIHGGGWLRGDETGPLLDTYGTQFIQKGLAVAALDYRLDAKNPYPDQNRDIACALSYLTTNADRLSIDTAKIIYFGDSAGGQLAAFAALNIPFAGYDYAAPVGVIDFYGVSDFATIVNGSRPDLNARRYLGSKYNNVADQASPTSYISKHAPRFIFFHGTKDTIVPISQSKSFYNQLIAVGIDSELITIDGARHGFIGPELPAAQFGQIKSNIDAFLLETVGK